ncbi:MAG: hypothetical protein GSR72_04890 [Desulfurococcales archaeon]|nr:hypothetical protein [Desulfurococcales archaeon]
MTSGERLLKYPWLLPIIVSQLYGIREPKDIAEWLGISSKTAKSLVYYASRMPEIYRVKIDCYARIDDRSFGAIINRYVIVARIRKRKIAGYTLVSTENRGLISISGRAPKWALEIAEKIRGMCGEGV